MLVAARWAHFGSLSVLTGSAAFLRFIDPGQRYPRGALRVVALVAALSGLAWLAGTIVNVAGASAMLDLDLLRVFFLETPFGIPFATRMALLAILLAAAFAPLRPRLSCTALMVLSAALLVDQAWLGHAAQGGRYGTVMILAYATHVLAAALWAGSLPILAVALWRARDDGAGARVLLARYSTLAVPCVALVVLSGTANTLFHAVSAEALIASTYGHVLAVKLLFVAAMLGLAAVVRGSLVPRLPGSAAVRDLSAALVALETIFALLAFGAAALLGLTPPPR